MNSLSSKTLVNFFVVNLVITASRLSQKKDISPGVSGCYQESKLKYVKDVFCIDQLSFVKPVTSVQYAVFTCRGQTFGKPGWIWVPVRK